MHGADLAREQVVHANEEVSAAEENLAAAKKRVEEAKRGVLTTEQETQAAQQAVERAAKDIAEAIVREPGIDPAIRTVSALIYTDRRFAWKSAPDTYGGAIERGRLALETLRKQLRPGAPILWLTDHGYTAETATEESLVAEPPTLEESPVHNYVYIQGGALSLNLPHGQFAQATEEELVIVRHRPDSVTLMSSRYQEGIEQLLAAASNQHWLLVGHEAIAAKIAQLAPIKQLVALTALTAAGVELAVSLHEEIKSATEQNLVELLAFLASGTGQETTTHRVHHRDGWTGRPHTRHVTEDTALTRMSKNVDKTSIRHLARTLGLSKDDIKTKASELLQGRMNKDTASLDQLAKDVKSLSNLDQVLTAIFG